MSELSREQMALTEDQETRLLLAMTSAPRDRGEQLRRIAPTVAAMLDEARAEVVRDVEAVLDDNLRASGGMFHGATSRQVRAVLTRHTPSAAAGAPLTASEQSGGAGVPEGADEGSERRTGPWKPGDLSRMGIEAMERQSLEKDWS